MGSRQLKKIHRFLSEKSEFPEVIDAKNLSYDVPLLQGIPMRLERINGGYSVAGENKFIEDYSCCSEEEAIEEATECLKCDLPIIVDESKCTGYFKLHDLLLIVEKWLSQPF